MVSTCTHANFMLYAGALELTPDHLIYNTGVALDELDNLGADFLNIVWYRNAIIAILAHCYCCIYTLQESVSIDTREDEAALVECLWTLCAGTDADSCNRFADRGKERAFLWECAGIRHDSKSVHLEAIVVVEAKRLVLDNARI